MLKEESRKGDTNPNKRGSTGSGLGTKKECVGNDKEPRQKSLDEHQGKKYDTVELNLLECHITLALIMGDTLSFTRMTGQNLGVRDLGRDTSK